SRFRNANRDSLIELVSTQLHPSGNTIARALLKLNEVIVHKRLRRFNELHFASKSAIVPPVSHQRRHSVKPSLVVDLDDKEIPSVFNAIRYLEIKRREPTFMLTKLLAV